MHRILLNLSVIIVYLLYWALILNLHLHFKLLDNRWFMALIFIFAIIVPFFVFCAINKRYYRYNVNLVLYFSLAMFLLTNIAAMLFMIFYWDYLVGGSFLH